MRVGKNKTIRGITRLCHENKLKTMTRQEAEGCLVRKIGVEKG